jgi:dolichol-phosphate mannosyltransferase
MAITESNWQVPAHRIQEFRPRATRFALCVFLINEGDRIRNQLRQMQQWANQIDIVIADGGSTDGAVMPDFLRERQVRTLLTKTGPGRLSAQMRMGFSYVLRQGYEGVVIIDGNNKDDVAAIPHFIKELEDGGDHIQGSRYIKGGSAKNTPLLRHWGVILLHAPLISIAARFRYTDTTNGFRAYSRKFLLDPRVQPFRDIFVGYELHYYLAIRAGVLGFNVKEIPVTRSYPKSKDTPTKIKGIKGNATILATLLSACFGKYDIPDHGKSEKR